MARPRSTDAAEFKPRAVKMITDPEPSAAEAARRLDIGENLFREWCMAFLARGGDAFPDAATCPPEDEFRRLRAEVTRLRAERDPLKRAAAYPPPARRVDSPVRRRPRRRAARPLVFEALEVSAAGYYAWAAREDSPTRKWRGELLGAIEGFTPR